MLGLPNELVWRTELSCGTVALLQSAPDKPPTGVVLCPEHDDQMVSIVATVRWDRHLAEQFKSRDRGPVAPSPWGDHPEPHDPDRDRMDDAELAAHQAHEGELLP